MNQNNFSGLSSFLTEPPQLSSSSLTTPTQLPLTTAFAATLTGGPARPLASITVLTTPLASMTIDATIADGAAAAATAPAVLRPPFTAG